MKAKFQLESRIMECWNVVDDLDLLFEDVTESEQLDQDQLSNILLGMKELYQLKFQRLFNTFETTLKE